MRSGTFSLSLVLLAAACGGHGKPADKPAPARPVATRPPPPPETEADREKKRHDVAQSIIAPGACIPASVKTDAALRLELAAEGGAAVVCAIDTDRSRLLGPVGCWKVDLRDKTLAYQDPAPLPGRGMDVFLDGKCARGYCLPAAAKMPENHIAHVAWSTDGAKVAVLAGDDVQLFDAATKAAQSTFSIRGDKGVTADPTGIAFVGDAVFVEAGDATSGGVWVFKADGTAVGPITALGAKETAPPVSTHGGSFSVLDKGRVAVAERGFAQLTVYEIDTGKRTKAVRRASGAPCKPAEVDAFWKGGDKVTDKCRGALSTESAPWVGADAIAGAKNLLVVMRGDRTGELGVVDPKTLIEDKTKTIKLPVCP